MVSKKVVMANLTGLGLLLGLSSSVAILSWRDYANAQTPMTMPEPGQTTQFRRLEQPLGLKIGVVAGGAALIGLELWWFLFRSHVRIT